MKQVVSNSILFILTLISSSVFISCDNENEPFKAIVTADKRIIQPGETVTFRSESINAEYVIWELDSARTTNSNSITKTFTKPGIYKVKLKAYSSNREVEYADCTIYVGKLKIKNFYTTQIHYFSPDYTPTDTSNLNPTVILTINHTKGYGNPNVSPATLPIYFLNFDPRSYTFIDLDPKVWNLHYTELMYYKNTNNLAYRFDKIWNADFYKMANKDKDLKFTDRYNDMYLFVLPITKPDEYSNLFASMALDVSE
ncbi:MAG: PKD domain-containing protein [Hymenobacteraceae bacterium]|nr:PKD domain-containing protein [Hymenobacteraceae bacterium]